MIDSVWFGKRIAGYRRNLKLSQSELSEKLNVTPQAISKWERGIALPNLELLLELSHLYNTTINELLLGSDIFSYIADRKYKYDDRIAYFISSEEKAANKAWANTVIKENLSIKTGTVA